MAKYFLASVGRAEAFKRDYDGNLTLAFTSNTLTDSGINISTTKDDIRGGQGGAVQFSFVHDPSVEITLTDIVWKPAYLEAQLGVEFNSIDRSAYKTTTVTFNADGEADLGDQALALPMLKCGNEDDVYGIWGAPKGSDEYKVITSTDGTSLKLKGASGEYCVRYLGNDDRAKSAEISTMIVPSELFLVITAPIYAGDACAASKGKKAGEIQFEIPRFQLNGAQELAFNMSSNQTMSLSGTAMAMDSSSCGENAGGKLLRIIEVIVDRDWKDEITAIDAEDDSAVVGKEIAIYGATPSGPTLISNEDLTFTPTGYIDGKTYKCLKAAEKDVVVTASLKNSKYECKFNIVAA